MHSSVSVKGKEMLDLGVIDSNLKEGFYESAIQFILDIRKFWENSLENHQPESEEYAKIIEISNYFEDLLRDLGDPQLVPEKYREIPEVKKKDVGVTKEHPKKVTKAPPLSKTKATKSKAQKQMTIQEKAELKQNIMLLPPEKLPGIIQIIKDTINMPQNQESLEFDIDTLPPDKCRELDQYVKDNIQGKPKELNEKIEEVVSQIPQVPDITVQQMYQAGFNPNIQAMQQQMYMGMNSGAIQQMPTQMMYPNNFQGMYVPQMQAYQEMPEGRQPASVDRRMAGEANDENKDNSNESSMLSYLII